MLVLEDNFSTKLQYETYIALGKFDGLHIGHGSLIKEIVKLAKENNKKSMILTFKNHPLTVINNSLKPKLLINNDMKLQFFKDLGVDIVNFINFDNNIMKMQPEEFLNNLLHYYNAKGIVVGFNFRFGYKNEGDVELLTSLKSKMNFEAYVMEPVIYDSEVISSSRIRKLIGAGNVAIANKMLMKPYRITGRVIKGRQLGRTIGFPTLNLELDSNYLIPGRGVYHTSVSIDGECYNSITNIGLNPTVQGENLSIECHVIEFNQDIYGKVVNVTFIERIRDEKKFNSLDELAKQLKRDKEYVIAKK